MQRRRFLQSFGAAALPLAAAAPSQGTIAYIRSGDLWVLSLPEGRPRRLTIGGQTHSPRFSHSGEWITCRVASRWQAVRADGTGRSTFHAESCRWVPGRDRLAVKENRRAYVTNPDGAGRQALPPEGSLPVFSADGKQMAYAAAVAGEGRLYRIPSDASEKPRLVAAKSGTNLIPFAWTSDAASILYWEDPDFSASLMADGLDLFRVSSAGGRPQPLRVNTLVREGLLALGPVSNVLAATVGSGRETWFRKRIAILDLDTAKLRHLTGPQVSAFAPAWSPDGKRIAYAAGPAAPGTLTGTQARSYLEKRRIHVAPASGGDAREITHDARYRDEPPAWSADGSHILFGRMDHEGVGAIWIMGSAGENPHPVAEGLTLEDGWFGYYGWTDWNRVFDWHRPPLQSD